MPSAAQIFLSAADGLGAAISTAVKAVHQGGDDSIQTTPAVWSEGIDQEALKLKVAGSVTF